MQTFVVEVYLPAAGKSFAVRVPRAMNSLLAAHLAAEALSELSGGEYLPSHSSLFAKRGSGRILDMNRSMEENDVENGTRLLLI